MKEIMLQTPTFSLTPRSLEEAMKFSEIMSKSSIVPKNYQGKTADILVAVQMGSEIGLKPMQSLQYIAVINGKPAIYGDALMALVQAHPQFEDIKEYFDEKLQAAVCTLKRINQSEHTVIYSIEDAKKANLWGKPGPWQQYPKRMLQMRARGFALRDKFADALGGLISAEEARDYPTDVTQRSGIPTESGIIYENNEEVFSLNERIDTLSANFRQKLKACNNLDCLKKVFIEANNSLTALFPSDHAAEELNKIVILKDEMKQRLHSAEVTVVEDEQKL